MSGYIMHLAEAKLIVDILEKWDETNIFDWDFHKLSGGFVQEAYLTGF